MRRSTTWLLVSAAALAACGTASKKSAIGGEVVETQVTMELPAPPEFVDPQPNADGTLTPLLVRRKGGQYMEQVVKIKGYVVFKYDMNSCVEALGEKVFKEAPEKCERPHFYIGDRPDTSTDKALWVVEVPRAPRADEKKVIPRSELNNPEMWPPEPKYAQGDEVIVEGTLSTKSPKGFVNSDGLLVFKSMEVVTPGAAPAEAAPAAPAEPAKAATKAPPAKGKKHR